MNFSGDSRWFNSISSKDLRMTHEGSNVESAMNIESLLLPFTPSPYPDRNCPRRNTQEFTVPRYNKLWSWWVSRSRRTTIYVNQKRFNPRKYERTTSMPYSATEGSKTKKVRTVSNNVGVVDARNVLVIR